MTSSNTPDDDAMPVLFFSHGVGPGWILDSTKFHPGMREIDKNSKSVAYMKSAAAKLALPMPMVILVVSAHWEEEEFTITSSANPSLLYDYYGFPEDTYHINWKPPGAPDVAEDIQQAIEAAGMKCKLNKTRGLDHGVFIPLMFLWPDADVPVLQLSLKSSMSTEEHLRLGEALAGFRKKGVMIIGSGQSTHNLSQLFPGKPAVAWTKKFGMWLNDLVSNRTHNQDTRQNKLIQSSKQEYFAKAHPTIEHFLPLSIAIAAAGYKYGTQLYEGYAVGTLLISHFIWK